MGAPGAQGHPNPGHLDPTQRYFLSGACTEKGPEPHGDGNSITGWWSALCFPVCLCGAQQNMWVCSALGDNLVLFGPVLYQCH